MHEFKLWGKSRMLTYFAACRPEAGPIIDHFRMKRRRAGLPFEVFESDETALVLTGIGKLHAATAAGFWAGLIGGKRNLPMLNIGIAGHATLEVGEAAMAHKVMDASSGKRWYPTQVFSLPCVTKDLTTVDRPETHYAEDSLYDMEAAGICEAALRFTTVELLQFVKVISDNRDHSARDVTPALAAELIEKQLELILGIGETVRGLAASLETSKPDPELLEAFRASARFTAAEKDILSDYLRRAAALKVEVAPTDEDFAELKEAPEILRRLRDKLYSAPARLR